MNKRQRRKKWKKWAKYRTVGDWQMALKKAEDKAREKG